MEGKALSWFQALRSSINLSTWIEFLIAIQVRFGRGSYDDHMETLSKLKQTGSLEEYKTQFEVLASRVLRLIDSHKLSMFNPKTLNDAYSLAKIQEEYLSIDIKSGKSLWSSSRNQGLKGFDQLMSSIEKLRRASKQRDKSVSFDTMEANFEGEDLDSSELVYREIESMELEKVDSQEEFKKQENAFLPRAELQETIQIGQEALL
jgi:hypothetical protein